MSESTKLDLHREHLGALRRALEARVSDLRLRLGDEPGDEGFRHELALASQLLRRVEAIEYRASYVPSALRRFEFEPDAED